MKTIGIVILVLGTMFNGVSQIRSGLSGSNYSGTTSSFINPSSAVDNPVWLDIRLAGLGTLVHNNYISLPNTTLYPYLKPGNNTVSVQDRYKKGFKHAYAEAHILGPAIQLNLKDHAFGISTSVRSFTSANRVPFDLAKLAFEDRSFLELQNTSLSASNMSVAHSSWAEIGFTYGKIIRKSHTGILKAGGTLKRLYGITGADLHVKDFNYVVNDTGGIETSTFNGTFNYADPAWKAGKGWGLDLGVTFVKTTKSAIGYTPHTRASNCEPLDYIYKLGISLVDVGYISYKTNNALNIEYSNGEGVLDASGDFSNAADLDASLSDLTNENGSSSNSSSFRQSLPTAVSVQFDYHVLPKVYVNASLVQNAMPSSVKGASRRSFLSVTPRFETKHFEVALPVSLIEYRYPSFGLMLRFNGFSIGSDIISPFIYKHDIYKADIYFNWSIPIIKSPNCRDKNGKTGGKRKKGSKYKTQYCPSF